MNEELTAITVPLQIKEHNGKPAVELRRLSTDTELMKSLISCAYRQTPIIIVPQFTKLLESLNSLMQKEIIYKDENDVLRFKI